MDRVSVSVTVRARSGKRVRAFPVDDVKPEHHWIDGKLGAWGRWARGRVAATKIGSLEGQYRAPWRQWHYPTYQELMPQVPNDEIRLIDRAVLRVPEQHRMALKLHYVFLAPPYFICRKVALKPQLFGWWMEQARAMALNNIRLLDSKA